MNPQEQEKRNRVYKVVDVLAEADKKGEVIAIPNLILFIQSQFFVSKRTALEYIELARYIISTL